MRRSSTLATLALAACQKPAPDAPRPPAPAPAPAAAAAAPAPAPAVTRAFNTYTYQCGDKTITLTVASGEGDPPATLHIDGKTVILPHAISGSGARYADDQGNELWTKGMTDGMLTLAGEAQRTCTATATVNPPAS